MGEKPHLAYLEAQRAKRHAIVEYHLAEITRGHVGALAGPLYWRDRGGVLNCRHGVILLP